MVERDFLDKIRETEQQAEELLDHARESARLKQEKARENALGILDQGREAAAAVQQKLLQQAEETASQLNAESADSTQRKVDLIQADCAKRLDQAVEKLVERIVRVDGHR